ncbi:carbohydrate ABC transporter permease [Humibacter albus]|uniref:carbohydrate ABC transporter permease n=1 Tax=Humibacter albus TaxID=427754 RepID=UPI0003B3425F|nr:carbohydrate ABC transporter permease [Humibacter albus]
MVSVPTSPARQGAEVATRNKRSARSIRLLRRDRARTTWWAVAQLAAAAVFLAPIIWMYVASFRPSLDIKAGGLIPSRLSFDNYINLFQLGTVPQAFLNSAIVAAISAVAVTVISTLAAYALSRFRFRGSGFVAGLLLAGQLVPGLVVLVPLVVALRQFGLANSLGGLTIAHLTLGIPIAVLLLRNYLADIPPALEEAAIVDGCSRIGALVRIVLPLLRPALAAVTAFSFILSWGEYLLALSLITDDSKKTLPLAMQSLFQLYSVDLGLVMAFGVVISLPVAVLFMFIQRSFVSNLSTGGVK